MTISSKKLESLSKKLPDLQFIALETEESKIQVFAFLYFEKTLPNEVISKGLIQANKIWDEAQERPKGYLIYESLDNKKGVKGSIFVDLDWLVENKCSEKEKEWNKKIWNK